MASDANGCRVTASRARGTELGMASMRRSARQTSCRSCTAMPLLPEPRWERSARILFVYEALFFFLVLLLSNEVGRFSAVYVFFRSALVHTFEAACSAQ